MEYYNENKVGKFVKIALKQNKKSFHNLRKTFLNLSSSSSFQTKVRTLMDIGIGKDRHNDRFCTARSHPVNSCNLQPDRRSKKIKSLFVIETTIFLQ